MEINRKDPGSNKSGMPMRGMVLWLLLLALFMAFFRIFSQQQERYQKLAYSDFAQLIRERKVRKCEIVNEASGLQYFVRGELVDLDTRTGRPKKFKVDVLSMESLQNMLDENKVYYSIKSQNPILWQVISSAVPFLLVLGLLYFLFIRQMRVAGRGAMSFGKSRARLMTRDRNKITFDDVEYDPTRFDFQLYEKALESARKLQAR